MSAMTSVPSGANGVPHRVLHEGVRHQDEVRRKPAANGHAHGSEKVFSRAKPLLAKYERANEGAFEQEREHPLHGERLADHTTGISSERRPVRAELELHRNTRHDADREGEAEDLCPESHRDRVSLVSRSQGAPFPEHQKPHDPHRELGKQVVIRDRERELQTMPERRVVGHDLR